MLVSLPRSTVGRIIVVMVILSTAEQLTPPETVTKYCPAAVTEMVGGGWVFGPS